LEPGSRLRSRSTPATAIIKLNSPVNCLRISGANGVPVDYFGVVELQVFPATAALNGKNVIIKGILNGRADGSKTYTRNCNISKISVRAIPAVTNVKLNKTKASLDIGKTIQLKVTVTPSKANKDVTWSSDKKSVATVSKNGLVKAVGKGTATITVKSDNGKTAKCKVTVTVPVKTVKLSQTSMTIKKGSTAQLKVTIEPKDASNKKVTWKTSDSKIAKVDKSGKVTAVKEGKATITVTSVNGKKSAKCSVVVSKKNNSDAVYETNNSFNFAQAVSDLISGDDFSAGIASCDDFYSKRLIVKAKTNTIDMSVYKPIKTVIGPDNTYILQFDTISAAKAVYNELGKRSDIIYKEPDQYVSIDILPVSGVVFSRSNLYKSWGVEHIEADQYAASLQGNTARIVVAVVDTGVWNHSFLNGRIMSGGYDFIDNDNDPTDEHNHGTHVAGTIVDCTPLLNIQILPVRVLNSQGRGTDLTVGNGIKYAADKGAQVINLSLGGGVSSYIDDTVDYAVKKGSIVVAAAGNDNGDTSSSSPAHLDSCIVVSAIDSSNNKASFSNYGASVDVAAPGVSVLSCVRGGGYQSLSGTSMATPHVSAVAAMYKLKYPTYSVSQIENLVRTYVMDLGSPGWDKYYGTGVPKLSKAIGVITTPTPTPVPTPTTTLVPTPTATPKPVIIQIATGGLHSLVLLANGDLYACGSNWVGQLGDGTKDHRYLPVFIGTGFTQIAAGFSHSLALKGDSLYAWGSNSSGELGDGTNIDKNTPVYIGSGYTQIAAGSHSLALKGNSLYAWGNNSSGELGDGTNINKNTPVYIGSGYTQIAAGSTHSLALKDSSLYAWGNNDGGHLGDGTNTDKNTPVHIGTGFSQISTGGFHSLALKGSSLYAWGDNTCGQFGDGTNNYNNTPVYIGTGYTQIAAGFSHSLALKGNSLYAWGWNIDGQLGDGTKIDKNIPMFIGTGFTHITAGYSQSLALKGNSLYSWGSSGGGTFSYISVEIPTRITLFD